MAKKEAEVFQNSKAQMHELCQAREVTTCPFSRCKQIAAAEIPTNVPVLENIGYRR